MVKRSVVFLRTVKWMAKVEVKTDILKWAADRSGRPLQSLLRTVPKFEKWIKGEDKPTFKQLEQFADATYTPLGYFFLEVPPVEKLPIPLYRTMEVVPDGMEVSANLYDTVQTMKQRQNWMREYLKEREITPLKFIQSVTENDSNEAVAQQIRETLKLSPLWAAIYPTWASALDHLRQRIEEARVMITINGVVGNNTHRKLDPQEFRGFVLVDEYAPFLFVNGSDGRAAQMFTLAHELAHLFLGHSAAFDLRGALPADDVIEKKCDRVAAEFLVPRDEFKGAWDKRIELTSQVQHLARHFKVSEIVIARRALDLGFVSRTMFFAYYEQYMNEDRRMRSAKSGGGDFYVNQKIRIGRRFAETVIRAAKEGAILYSEAYRLTGLRGRTYDEFASSIGCDA